MRKNKLLVKTDLGILDYVTVVNALVSDFFDADDGTYVPHIGKMNAIRVFYNECVLESKFNIEHDIIDPMDLEPLLNDKKFMKAFDDAVKGNGKVCLNFANAYSDALEIVNTEKSSLANIAEMLKKSFSTIVEKLTPVLSENNITKLEKIANNISNGNFNVDTIIEAYNNSKK